MKYKVIVEGGFTGIPREYEGELGLTPIETKSILEGMNMGGTENQNIRDGLNYIIEIENNNKMVLRKFDEATIPQSIRKFIDKVKTIARQNEV